MSQKIRILNKEPWSNRRQEDGITLVLRNDAPEKPAEVRIYQAIGSDPWDNSGLTADAFANAMREIPRDREVDFHVNSPGGDVWDGLAIRTMIDEWPRKTRTFIDGVAASTASWAFLNTDEVHMPKHAQMFIHDAWGIVAGSASDMNEMADRLDKTSDQIAQMYADKSGIRQETMRRLMQENTLMTGDEAKQNGLVDFVTDEKPMKNFTPDWIAKAKAKLAAMNKQTTTGPIPASVEQPTNLVMNKTQLLALLREHKVEVKDDATDEQLQTALANLLKNKISAPVPEPKPAPKEPTSNPELDALKTQINNLTALNQQAEKLRVTNKVKELIAADKLPANLEKDSIESILALPSLEQSLYDKLPVNRPGGEPVNTPGLEVKNDEPRELLSHFGKFQEPMKAWQRGNNIAMKTLGASAMERGQFFNKHKDKLVRFMNTNTIDATLKRDVILQDVIVDFSRRLLPFTAFTTKYENVPLEGSNKVQIPFYDLDTVASISWNPSNGYNTASNTATDNREITVGYGAGDGDRLRVDLGYSSEEIARQPYLDIRRLLGLKVEKLASDIMTDVLSVITVANFGSSAKTVPAASISSDDLADMKLACKLWPAAGRSLFLDSAWDANLLKDTAFKHALNAASDSAIKEGRLYPRVFGFDYIESPVIPTNSENLIGFALFRSAILFATAPVPPVQEVRNAGTMYQLIVEPESGITLEYRSFGANVLDTATHSVEQSYGWAKGNGNALKRMQSAAL